MKTAIINSESYERHVTGDGHPEQPKRVTAIKEKLKKRKDLIWEKPDHVPEDILAMTHSKNYIENLKEEYPNELFLSIDNSNYEEKIKEILNVISSLNRFSIINKIDKSIKIEHEPRVRKDISKIYFVTNYELGKTLVPTFRSYSLNIDLYSTSEIFYDASDLKKLADFEATFIPVSNKYINKISANDASNIKIKIEKILIEDFLTIENVFQNNLFAKNYELNTGNAKIKRNNCVKRDLFLWKVSTNNIISQT